MWCPCDAFWEKMHQGRYTSACHTESGYAPQNLSVLSNMLPIVQTICWTWVQLSNVANAKCEQALN